MKKRVLFILLILISVFIFVPAKADTGWDTDYDSSWGSSSSYDDYDNDYDYDYDDDYDYDYDDDDDYDYGTSNNYSSGYSSSYGSGYSSSSNRGDSSSFLWMFLQLLFPLLLVGPFLILILYLRGIKKNNKKRLRGIPKRTYNYMDVPNNIAIEYGIDDVTGLKNELYNDFVALQEAWMNFDYDKMHSLCTDDLYNTYKSQLDVLKLKNNQNIMKDFVLDEIKLYSIYNQGDTIVINVYLSVNFYDYVIDTRTNAVTRGNSRSMVFNRYKLTYIKNVSADKVKYCPNCGHELGSDASSKCPYCGTTIVNANKKFVLSEKSRI